MGTLRKDLRLSGCAEHEFEESKKGKEKAYKDSTSSTLLYFGDRFWLVGSDDGYNLFCHFSTKSVEGFWSPRVCNDPPLVY